jgi:hypothetical protein
VKASPDPWYSVKTILPGPATGDGVGGAGVAVGATGVIATDGAGDAEGEMAGDAVGGVQPARIAATSRVVVHPRRRPARTPIADRKGIGIVREGYRAGR